MRPNCKPHATKPFAANIPYPDGATVAVNVEGERPIAIDVKVKDLLVVGMGDSFASGEGNPDVPVELDESRRVQNLYPARMRARSHRQCPVARQALPPLALFVSDACGPADGH